MLTIAASNETLKNASQGVDTNTDDTELENHTATAGTRPSLEFLGIFGSTLFI